jgi:hypothetical protein
MILYKAKEEDRDKERDMEGGKERRGMDRGEGRSREVE